jgi:hypothetical protein
MVTKPSVAAKQSLLFLGSFVFGQIVQRGIHELGHALATWIAGGEVYGIRLHPFLPGRCDHSATDNPVFTTWGGVGLPAIVGIALAAALWRRRRPELAPLFAVSAFALVGSGSYFLVGLVFQFGDPWYLVSRLGQSPLPVVLFGLLSIGLGVLFCAVLLGPVFGIDGSTRAIRTTVLLNLGVQPYLVATLLDRHFTGSGGRARAAAYMAGGFVIVLLLVVVSRLLSVAGRSVHETPPAKTKWVHVVVALAAASAVIVAELLAFST